MEGFRSPIGEVHLNTPGRRAFLYAVPTAAVGAITLANVKPGAEAAQACSGTADTLDAVNSFVAVELRAIYERGRRGPLKTEDARRAASTLRLLVAVKAFAPGDAAIKRHIDTFGINAGMRLSDAEPALRRELRNYASSAELDRLFAETPARQRFLEVAQREGLGPTVLALAQGIEASSRSAGTEPVSAPLSDSGRFLFVAYSQEACSGLQNQIYYLTAAALAMGFTCPMCGLSLAAAALVVQMVYDQNCK